MQRLPNKHTSTIAANASHVQVVTATQIFAGMASLCLTARRLADAEAWLTELISAVVFVAPTSTVEVLPPTFWS